jgi:SAM-dependent methyltransferase
VSAQELARLYAALSSQPEPINRVGWHSRLQQLTYLAALVEIGVGPDHSVLDVGCGQGDLYGLLIARGFQGRYTGIDLSPELVGVARERFPSADFGLGDVLETEIEQHDFVLASGLFDYRTSDSPTRLRATLRRMFEQARLGLAWNMFAEAPSERRDLYHEPLADLLAVCDALSPHFILRRDYDPGHFTVYLYHREFFMTDRFLALIGRLTLEPELRADVKRNPASYADEYGLTFQQLNLIAALLEAP